MRASLAPPLRRVAPPHASQKTCCGAHPVALLLRDTPEAVALGRYLVEQGVAGNVERTEQPAERGKNLREESGLLDFRVCAARHFDVEPETREARFLERAASDHPRGGRYEGDDYGRML